MLDTKNEAIVCSSLEFTPSIWDTLYVCRSVGRGSLNAVKVFHHIALKLYVEFQIHWTFYHYYILNHGSMIHFSHKNKTMVLHQTMLGLTRVGLRELLNLYMCGQRGAAWE